MFRRNKGNLTAALCSTSSTRHTGVKYFEVEAFTGRVKVQLAKYLKLFYGAAVVAEAQDSTRISDVI